MMRYSLLKVCFNPKIQLMYIKRQFFQDVKMINLLKTANLFCSNIYYLIKTTDLTRGKYIQIFKNVRPFIMSIP